MHSRKNWDDIRFVLAVADAGSVSAAARELNVNHATVLRRIAAFEYRHGVEIFDKTARGYAIIKDRMRVIDAAREVDAAVQSVARVIKGTQAPLHGVVRVTSTDTFCHVALPPIISRIHDAARKLRIELMSTNAHLDLGRLHADITVRPANVLPDDLSGRVAAKLGFAVYTNPEVDPTDWLGLSGALLQSSVGKWMVENIDAGQISAAGDSFITLRELAAAGLGRVILPCFIGDGAPLLVRKSEDLPDLSVDIWVASHVDLAEVPRIRAVRELIVRELCEQSEMLLGHAS